jgi:hypothetical protein
MLCWDILGINGVKQVKESDMSDPLLAAENGAAVMLPEDDNNTSELLWDKSGTGKDVNM